MTDEIDQLLDSYHAADLSSMASEAGISTSVRGKSNRSSTVSALRQHFFEPERIRAGYAKLSDLEKTAFNRILLHSQATPTRILRRELIKSGIATEVPVAPEPEGRRSYGYSEPKSYEGSPTKRGSTVFEDVMARLTLHGLVFSLEAQGSSYSFKQRFHPGALLVVPQSVRAALPEPTPVSTASTQLQPEEIKPSDPNRLLRELYLYWDYARRGGINLLNSGAVGKRELKVLNGLMFTPDPAFENARKEEDMPHLYFLRRMLQNLGLLRMTAGQLQPAISKPLEIPDFWRWPVEQQLVACLKKWLVSDTGAETVDPRESDNPRIANAREKLVQILGGMGDGEWFQIDELLEYLWAMDVGFLYASHTQAEESNRWYGGTFQGRYYYGEKEKFIKALEASERQFIEKCLDDSLPLLGLTERGIYRTGSGKEKILYRLNALGQQVVAAHLSKSRKAGEEKPAPSDTGRILLQPNFHLVAMGPVPLAVLAQLDLFAVRLQVGVGAFEYELTRESVYQAHQNGMEAEAIRAQLVELCGGALPQNVDRTLSEWAQHQERIVFRSGVDILQTADPALLEKLAALAPVSAQMERTLTPSLALLNGGSVDKTVTALKEAGQLPIVSDALPAAADKSILLDEKGGIQPVHPLPSLYLEGRLAKIAEPSKKGQWKLSQASVNRAGGSRSKISDLLAELAALSQSPLAEPLVEQIKAWGSYYGSAGIAQVTLIEFQSRAVLDELLKMAELGKRLRAFDDKQPLAIVAEKDVAQVKKTLDRLGLSIKNSISRA
jgi:hypothetical protein